MPRPSRQTDRLLIRAALELLPRGGLSGLKVRQVAARAGVNLGMFHYHFGNKREFNRQVLRAFYGEFFASLTAAIAKAGGASPRERLRAAVLAMIRFAREHRAVLLSILRDVLNGDREVIGFVRENFPRHIAVMFRLVRECQRAGSVKRLPLPVLMPLLAGPQIGSVLAVATLEHAAAARPLGIPFALASRLLLTDRAIARRLDLSLAAIGTGARA